ncbi:MAG: DedA family protein [Chloroflexota bacterium]
MLDGIDQLVIPFLERMYETVGYIGLAAVMAIENAFFFLPVPSEVVLPLAGFVVARGASEPLTGGAWTYPLAVLFAVLGTTLGSLFLYAIAALGGRPLLERYGRYIFIDAHDLEVADRWFERYGAYAVFFARMVPIARSVISIPAGVARMPLWRFALFSALGTVPWVMLLIWAGMVLGESWLAIKDLLQPYEYVVIGALVVLFAYFLWRQLRPSRSR